MCACVVYMCEEGRYSSKSKEVIAGCEEVCVLPLSSRRREIRQPCDNHATTQTRVSVRGRFGDSEGIMGEEGRGTSGVVHSARVMSTCKPRNVCAITLANL